MVTAKLSRRLRRVGLTVCQTKIDAVRSSADKLHAAYPDVPFTVSADIEVTVAWLGGPSKGEVRALLRSEVNAVASTGASMYFDRG